MSPVNWAFFNMFNDFLDYLSDLNLPVILTGDLNLDMFKLSDLNSYPTSLFETLVSNGFVTTISRATRITLNSSTLLDIFGVRGFIQNLRLTGVMTSTISDHYVPFNIFNLDFSTTKPPQYFDKRSFTETNLNNFTLSLAFEDWNEVLASDNVNVSTALLIDKFLLHYNTQIPIKRVRFNRRTMPINKWQFKGLLKSRLKKLNLETLSKHKDATNIDVKRYSDYRNHYNRAASGAKRIYYKKRVVKAGKDAKKLWQILRESMGLQKKNNNVEFLEVGGVKIEGDVNISNCFNDYFANVGRRLIPEIPKTNKSFLDYLPTREEREFIFQPVDETLVLNYIQSIKPKHSTDNDDISMNLIHKVAIHIIKPLVHIINLSFREGIFPDRMKISKVIAIFKGGIASLLDNFRGVSLINCFSKIIERIVYARLMIFLEEGNFFYQHQFGFRKGHSTQHAILSLINKVSSALASNKVAMIILLDIRKCFDMIDRNILLIKLEHYGIRGRALAWFRSYFSGRSQRMFFNGISSSKLEQILLGVLQGSVLGVLLFLIFINDLGLCCPNLIAFLFADDNAAYLQADNINDLITLSNNEIPLLIDWYSSNNLLLHPKKTKTILFCTPRQRLNFDDIQLRSNFPVYMDLNDIGENILDKISNLKLISFNGESFARHLGILLDPKLSYKNHFEAMYTRVSRAVFSMKQMKNLLDGKHLTLLYNAYVKSTIEYASALFTGVLNSTLRPIFLLQKRAVRIITRSSYRAETRDLFKRAKILPIEKIIQFNAAKIMFDYRYGLLPNSFNGTWKTNREVREGERVLRDDEDYSVRTLRSNFLRDQPLFKLPIIWNSLPLEIKSILNRKQFIKSLFNHLLNEINH
jgi:hypothetical protein